MMVGHSMLAFALAAGAARVLGWSDERALTFGAVAAAFAVVPDADMVYAVSGVATADLSGVFVVTNAFWGASTEIHRSATHSLVLAGPAAAAFALWTAGSLRSRAAAVTLLSGLTGVAYAATGGLDAFALAAFGFAGIAVAAVVERRGLLPPSGVLAAALVALVSHPFGDLFTGSAPVLFYPFEGPGVDGIVVLSADPTLHLLGAFALELTTVWLAGLVYLRLTHTPLGEVVDRRAALGVAYAPTVFLLPHPTPEVSYHFVFSIVGVGLVLAAPTLRPARVRAAVRGSPVRPQTDGGVGVEDDEWVEAESDDGGSTGREAYGGGSAGRDTGDGGSSARDAEDGVAVGPPVLPNLVLTGAAAVTAAWVAYLVVYSLT